MIRKQESMLQPIVAMNIGSSGIRAIAADWDERHGVLHILGSECSNRHQSVEKGIPTNTSDVGFMMHETLTKLSNRVGRGELRNTFVCVGGRSLQAVHVGSHRLQRKSEVKEHLLNEMIKECKDKIELHTPAAGVLTVIPERWIIDEQVFDERPKRIIGKEITLEATAFVMRKEYCAKIDDTQKRAAMTIYHTEIIPDALVSALTNNDDQQRGCAIIDMGAQTTTLSIYSQDMFVHTRVIPLGGYHVTHDISTLGISLLNAEKLKRSFGNLTLHQADANKGVRVPSAREQEEPVIINIGNLSTVIACRIDEIMAPIIQDINKHKDSIANVYLTGGAAMLKGLVPYLQKKIPMPLDYGSHAEWLAHDTEDDYYKPTYSALIGTLLLGQRFIQEHPNEPPTSKGLIDKIRDLTGTLFGGEEY